MSTRARLTAAAGGVIVLLSGSGMIASAHTTASPQTQSETTANHQTSWNGNGSDNLPCTGGTLHWIFTGGDQGTYADLYINGALVDSGEQKGGSGNGAWHFYTSSAGVTNGPPRTNVYVQYDGSTGGKLVISSCEGGSTTTTEPSTSTTSTSTSTTSTSTTSTTETTEPSTSTTTETTEPSTSTTTETTEPSTSTTTETTEPSTSTTTETTEPTTSTTETTTVPTITTDTGPTTSTTTETTEPTTSTTETTTVPTITTDTAPTTSTDTAPTTSTTSVPTITTDTAPTTNTTTSAIPSVSTTTSPGQTLPSESTRPGGVVPTEIDAGLDGSDGSASGGPNLLAVGGLAAGLLLMICGGWSVLRELRRVH